MLLTSNLSVSEFIGRAESLGIKPYAIWKVAQYHRYGISTASNLIQANKHYLEALAEAHGFPEIFYDAGDFAEYFAYSQPNTAKRLKALKQAFNHYCKATEEGIDEGYRKQIEILKKIDNLEKIPDLQTRITNLASHAAQRNFVHAKNLLHAAGHNTEGRIEFLNLEQHVSNYINYLEAILRRDKCPSF